MFDFSVVGLQSIQNVKCLWVGAGKQEIGFSLFFIILFYEVNLSLPTSPPPPPKKK